MQSSYTRNRIRLCEWQRRRQPGTSQLVTKRRKKKRDLVNSVNSMRDAVDPVVTGSHNYNRGYRLSHTPDSTNVDTLLIPLYRPNKIGQGVGH